MNQVDESEFTIQHHRHRQNHHQRLERSTRTIVRGLIEILVGSEDVYFLKLIRFDVVTRVLG